MSEDSVINLREQLRDVQAFVKTAAYRSYVATIKLDIKNVEENILQLPPDSQENISILLQLHGRREELSRSELFFEDAQVTLKKQIDDIVETQSQEPGQQ